MNSVKLKGQSNVRALEVDKIREDGKGRPKRRKNDEC